MNKINLSNWFKSAYTAIFNQQIKIRDIVFKIGVPV